MGLDYTHEKMSNAADALATGLGDLRSRLESAWLACHTLRPTAEDFADKALRDRFGRVSEEITAKPAGPQDDGSLRATLRQASDDDLRRWAREFLEISQEVAEKYARQRK